MSSVLQHVAKQVREFAVLLSIAQEPNRDFGDTWQGLNVQVQKSLMMRQPWKHAKAGFEDELYVHFPIDTLTQLIRRKPDIVFSYELGFRSMISAIYCRLFRKRLALCVCVSEHTEVGRGRLRHLLRKLLLRWADAISYNGPSCLEYLRRFRVNEEKLFHFPYACSEQFRYAGPVEREPTASRKLICIGQLIERKGVLPLLTGLVQYCQSHPDRTLQLDLVGKGIQEESLKAISVPSNLQVRFLGHLNYQAMAQAMEQNGVLVFPTLADEWGLVVNEAFAAGMPVIGSEYAQSCTTLIQEGQTGWLFKPDDPQTLFRALESLYATSDEALLAMRYNCQKTVENITPRNVAASAIAMFERLLKK
jgi:glycosyltransferase involved in cell wall biosynthesis